MYNGSRMNSRIKIYNFSHQSTGAGKADLTEEFNLVATVWADANQNGTILIDNNGFEQELAPTHTFKIRARDDITVNQWVYWDKQNYTYQLHIIGTDRIIEETLEYLVLICTLKKKVLIS